MLKLSSKVAHVQTTIKKTLLNINRLIYPAAILMIGTVWEQTRKRELKWTELIDFY